MSARTPYIITHGRRFLCVTCRTVIYKRRDIDAHVCPPLPEQTTKGQAS